MAGRGTVIENLWRQFFSDPSQWWDSRPDKVNSKYPDFKHKKTQEGLWLIDRSNPPWVESKLAAMAPGTVQLNIFCCNKRLAKYVKAREFGKTIELYQEMRREGMNPDKFTFVPVLNACSRLRALEQGKSIHSHIRQTGHEADVYIGSALVNMYTKCGSIEDALQVFRKLPVRDVVSWTAVILGCAKCGQGGEALELYRQMLEEGIEPNHMTFVGVLNACATKVSLEEGRHVHEQINQRGHGTDIFLGNALIDMYAKCGSIEEAWGVFSNMVVRDLVSWNAMIFGYVKCGQGQTALELFQQMHAERVEPDNFTFVGVLSACASLVALEEGRHIHDSVVQRGYELNPHVSNGLVDMYAKCGSIDDAWLVFRKMPRHDVVSWNAMILGYVKCGEGKKALELVWQMQQEGVDPDPVTFVGWLNACASLGALEEGRHVHEQIIRRSFESEVFVGNSLVDMYAKCGSIEEAHRVFNKMPIRNLVSWNAMLGGYAMHGHSQESLSHFERMSQEGLEIDEISFACLMAACSHGGLVEEGLYYFGRMTAVCRLALDNYHYASMVDLLGRAGRLHEAEDMIKTSMSCEPTPSLWMSLLGACSLHGNVEMGEFVAKTILKLDPEDATENGSHQTCMPWLVNGTTVQLLRERLEKRLKEM